jgi:hypothetical protein
MKVQRLLVSAVSLSLIAALGCGPKHVPVPITVLVPSQDQTPAHTESSSVLAEKKAVLTFEAAPGSPSNTTLEVQFLKNNVARKVCSEETGTTLKGPSPLTCHLITSGDFDITIDEISGGGQPVRKPKMKAYIRPCKGCST